MLLIFIDAGFIDFQVPAKFVDLLQLTLLTIVASYFGGRSLEKVKSKTPHFLPPASKNKIEFQLLHEDVLEKFFKYYNEITQSPEHRDLRAAKRLGKYTPTMELLERFDC